MKKIILPAAACALLVFGSSCGNNGEHKIDRSANKYYDSIRTADSLANYGPPTEIQYAEAIEKANDGKRASIIGYLDVPNNSYSTGSSGQLGFIERPNQMNGPFNFILSITLGKDKNSMKALPDKYTTQDVVVTDKNGNKISAGDRVKMTGKLHANETYASLDVQEIEKLENTAIDYSTLNATKLTAKPGKDLDGKLVMVEGTLEMPVLSMGGENTFLYVHVPGIEEQLTANIAYGSGPAQLEPLPENYSDKDVKIQDNKGGHINMKKKVRLYGMWKNDRIHIESVENI